MQRTRLIELSIFEKIQDRLSRTISKGATTSANFLTYKLKYNNIRTQYPVVVYANGIVYNSSGYSVDYVNGIINFNTPLTSVDVVQVDYTYCYVNVYDESMSPSDNNFAYPAVAVYEMRRHDVGFELGNNVAEMHPRWVIEVWADRGGERNDYTDLIVNMLEEGMTLPIIDFNIAFPVNADGTINTSYSEIGQRIAYMFIDGIKYNKGGSLNIGEKPRFLTEIFVNMTIVMDSY
jgi:hypothetical protein